MAWRSQEQSYYFKQKLKDTDVDVDSEIGNRSRKGSGVRKKYHDGIGPERMPDEFFAKDDVRDATGRLIASAGDFNLSQVSGEKARRYFEGVLRIPMPPGVSRVSNTDPVMQETYGRKEPRPR